MKTIMKLAWMLAVVTSLTFVCAAEAPHGCASAPASQSNDEPVYFLVSRSTNTPHYCYTLTRSGALIKETGPSRVQLMRGEQPAGQPAPVDQQGTIAAPLAEKIFGDVEAARPLSGLPREHCAKSVSFGTTTHVYFKGEKSPDLCEYDNEKVEALKGDLAKIMSTARFEQPKP
jgi:hypothetical protein